MKNSLLRNSLPALFAPAVGAASDSQSDGGGASALEGGDERCALDCLSSQVSSLGESLAEESSESRGFGGVSLGEEARALGLALRTRRLLLVAVASLELFVQVRLLKAELLWPPRLRASLSADLPRRSLLCLSGELHGAALRALETQRLGGERLGIRRRCVFGVARGGVSVFVVLSFLRSLSTSGCSGCVSCCLQGSQEAPFKVFL